MAAHEPLPPEYRSIHISIPWARRVLDVGCGTGWVLAEALKENRPALVGLDHAVNAFRGGIGSPSRTGGRSGDDSAIQFVAGDGLNLPFPDNVFDVVVGHVSLPYMNTSHALRELYRVLSPGGCFLLTFHSWQYLRQAVSACWRARNWRQFPFLAYVACNGLLNHVQLPQTSTWWNRRIFETINTPRGVARSAHKAGFTLISTEYPAGRIFFAATARKPDPDGIVLPPPSWASYARMSRRAEWPRKTVA